MFEAVQHLVLELAREQLVCLVLEDLHWSDATSLDLVTFLASTVDSGQLLLVATTRPEGASRLARLVALGELLSLRPLADDAMRELAAGLTDPPEGALLEQIIALGEGIPLYVEELIAVQAASPSRVPGALALTFTARLAGLSQTGRQVLDAVAVAEGEVPADLLRKRPAGQAQRGRREPSTRWPHAGCSTYWTRAACASTMSCCAERSPTRSRPWSAPNGTDDGR